MLIFRMDLFTFLIIAIPGGIVIFIILRLNEINKKLDILMGKIATMKIMKSIKDEHPDIDE